MKKLKNLSVCILSVGFTVFAGTGCVHVQHTALEKQNHILECSDGTSSDQSVLRDNSTSFSLFGGYDRHARNYYVNAPVGTERRYGSQSGVIYQNPDYAQQPVGGVGGPYDNGGQYYGGVQYDPPYAVVNGRYPDQPSGLPGANYQQPAAPVYRSYPDQPSRLPGAPTHW